MNRPAGTEMLRSWKATNDTTNPLGARHGLVTGNLPLNGSGERTKLACLDKTEELLAGNVGVCPVRHHGSGVPSGLEAQEAVALWMRKNSESRERAQEEEDDGKAKFRTCARRAVLKGQARPLTFNAGPAVSAGLSLTRARPGETAAHSCDASVPAEYGPATSACGHDGMVTSVTSAEMPAPITVSTFTTTAMTTPTKRPQATMATITNKSSRASLQLTHELGGYIRWMRSHAPTENVKNTINTEIVQLSLSVTP
jgi:hypothetical protein